jgi:small subunit ribosomal protein S16
MAVKIRLRRTGRKKQPSYRLVVADTDTPRDGQYLDAVGTYNPLTKPADLRIDLEKVDKWLARGRRHVRHRGVADPQGPAGRRRKVAVRGVGPDGPDPPWPRRRRSRSRRRVAAAHRRPRAGSAGRGRVRSAGRQRHRRPVRTG